MAAAWFATPFAAHFFDVASRVAEVLIAASAALRFGPAHVRYCEIASEVLAPRASEMAASHAASAFASTVDVVFGWASVGDAPVLDPPVGFVVLELPSATAELDVAGVGGGSDATTTGTNDEADGIASTSPSEPELLLLKTKINPTMPSRPTTATIATMGNRLFEGLFAA